jgi:YidC/Oxa1 family membrane protein insertase
MDQKRLMLAIAVSIAILLGFQFLVSPHLPHPPAPPPASVASNEAASGGSTATPAEGSPGLGAQTTPPRVAKNVPRLKIDAPRLQGSISLVGARIDDLILTDYHDTQDPNSPNVRLLEPLSDKQPYYVQYGWTPAEGEQVAVPGSNTLWTASADTLSSDHPVTLSWDNGAGLTFELQLSVDDNYMFDVQQSVKNATGAPVKLFPWAKISRDYTPEVAGYYILFEGLLGVTDGTLHETTYAKAKSEGEKTNGVAYDQTTTGGWGGITDKYWMATLVPDQSVQQKLQFIHTTAGAGGYQVDFITQNPTTIAPGTTASQPSHLFAGAKIVRLLDRYESQYHIPNFDKAVDFGWFYLITKPIFYCLDWLNGILGNFGLAIIAFTTCVKLLFFPLANYSYRSMSKMKLLGPKMQALRERLKDDPSKMQAEMMAMYRAEKVNPASGCLPMVVQIPVFFSLYKVIFTTIEMRQAPFYGWIHDLSQPDPTNVFNLFGLIPFDPATISPYLHLGLWPLIMGCTMFLQQKLNPPPPDPVQARMFQFMPIIFTFMLARFPAGLVIYWTTNNLLSVAQQWFIMRRTRLARPGRART